MNKNGTRIPGDRIASASSWREVGPKLDMYMSTDEHKVHAHEHRVTLDSCQYEIQSIMVTVI
jgi:hypothetical protein